MSKPDDAAERNFAFLDETYRALADSLPICLVLKDITGRFVYVNKAFLDFEGKSFEEVVGTNEFDLYAEEYATAFRADDQVVQESGESIHDEVEYDSINGRKGWAERIKSPVLDANGKIVGIQLLFWDVTRRKQAEESLARERFLLNTLLDNIPDSIYFKDLNSRYTRVSRSLIDKHGLSEVSDVSGMSDADVFTSEHAEQARADEQKIIETGQPIVGRIEKETWPDAGDTWCSTTKMALRNASGEVIGTFGVSRDFTKLKNAEDDLRRARDEANAAIRTQADFVANMSHEIRTPMNGIIGMTELLADTKMGTSQREYLGMIEQSAASLLTLVNDILDFSKVESGTIQLEEIPFSLSDCVGKTVQTLATRAAEKGLELACRVAPDLPDRLIGDPGRLRQILVNLVGNAIKFTKRGEVVVDVDTESRDNGDVVLHVRVRDTGIGIPEGQQESIFKAFEQADASTTRRYGGTGLGLTISNQLVQLMEGRLWVDSEVGRGATFHFTAKLQVAHRQPMTSQHLDALAGLKTLIVDDNETNRRILDEILKSWNLTPVVAAGGVEAYAELSDAVRKNEPYELVLLDCMMPGMDGFALAELVVGNADFESPIMIMISSAARPDDSKRCEEVGIFRHMTKPVVKSQLFNTIIESVGVDAPSHASTSEPPLTEQQRLDRKSLRVLLVEDGLINQQVALGFLEQAGHRVSIANDGREAVDAFQNQSFDVILMDLQMPTMDGFAATREIRSLEQHTGSHIRIVAMTAAAMMGDREKCLAKGMDDYISKPIRGEEILSVLQHDSSAEAPGDSATVQKYFDATSATSNVPGGEPVLRDLIHLFLTECPRLIHQITTGLAESNTNLALATRAAHTLTSSAKTVCAIRIADASEQIEASLRQADYRQAREQAADLQTAAEKTYSTLEQWLG